MKNVISYLEFLFLKRYFFVSQTLSHVKITVQNLKGISLFFWDMTRHIQPNISLFMTLKFFKIKFSFLPIIKLKKKMLTESRKFLPENKILIKFSTCHIPSQKRVKFSAIFCSYYCFVIVFFLLHISSLTNT